MRKGFERERKEGIWQSLKKVKKRKKGCNYNLKNKVNGYIKN